MLTLAIGDLYIPERSIDLPSKFRKLLSPNPDQIPSNNKISDVICLGNVINSIDTLTFLYNLSSSFHIVKGEYDDIQILSQQLQTISNNDKQIPLYNVITHDNLKIGFTNGFQIVPKNDPLGLSALARELDVDILIWGGTHKVEAYTLDGKFFINPGSATGAFNFDWPYNDEDDDEEQEQEQDAEGDEEKVEEEGLGETEEKEGVNKGEEDAKPQDNDENYEGSKSDDKEVEEKIEHTGEKVDDEATERPKASTINDINRAKEKPTSDSTQFDQELLNAVTEMNANIPSFCLLDIQGSLCTLYIYTLLNNEVKVDKVSYSKE